MTRLHGILALAVAAGFGILLIAIPAELAPFLDGRMRQVVLAVVAAAVGVTLTASLVAAHFRYRFAHLVKTAERIAGGDYTATVVPRGYGFEARLGRAVNDIAAALVDTHDRATFDRLTGVANRQSLLAQLFAEVERAARYERPLSVAFVDIDHFKAVNDTYGHAVGDVVLRGVAQEISDNLRASDMIGRYGGEEFMLILTETGVEEGAVLTEKLRSLVQRRRFTIDGAPDIAVTISIGIAGGSGAKLRMDTLVRDADAAMYSAKSLGRNQTYIFAEPDDDARVPRAPISAAGRARAMAIGQLAREAATSALASVLDPLPHYRGQPSALIASIVVALGRQLQLPDAEIDRLRVAALLHDVGKIAVPEEILEKPSALTSAEWRTVVQHPRIGQVILEQAATLKDAVPIILHHHERYAGHGYPYGLRANEIPLGARIVAIADAYDAMINDRPYKRAISHEQAISELRRHAGTQFDPELVELFCDLYADQAPEPDQTVVAMAAAHRGQGRPALVLPDLGTGRTVRKRRPIAPLATPDGGLAGGTGRRGARGVADPGARRRARAGTRGRRPDQQAIRPAIEGRPHGHRCRLTSPTGTLWDGSRNSECRPRYLADEGPSLACRSTPAADAGSGPEHPADREGDRTVNKVMLTGRLTRDPEMRSLASGKNVTTFTVASNEFLGGGREKAEYSNVVTWDRLAEIAGTYLGKGQQVAIEGRLQTRSWDDDRGQRHWKTEVVASHVEMLSGRRKKDYEAQQAADSLVAQAERFGDAPPTEPVPESAEVIAVDGDDDDDDETEEGEGAAA